MSQLGQAQLRFSESAVDRGLEHFYDESLWMGGGAASFDFDLDGDQDLYVVGGEAPDALFLNDGTGNFENISEQVGLIQLTDSVMTTSVVTGDIDNDGYREIFVGTIGKPGTLFEFSSNLLLQFDQGSMQYVDISEQAGIRDSSFCMGGHFLDVNLDGYIDLYLINYIEEPGLLFDSVGTIIGFDHQCQVNDLFINQGDGTFVNKTSHYGIDLVGCSLASTSSDIDSDGDYDLILANDFGKWLQPNQVFRNDFPQETFTDISVQSGANAEMYAMGVAVGDYNEDSHPDFYITNIADNYFFENSGSNTFQNIAPELEVQDTYADEPLYTTGWGTFFADLDNDTHLDLFVANGFVYSGVDRDGQFQSDKLYRADGVGGFTESGVNSGVAFEGSSRGAIVADFDNNGSLDLITVSNERLFTDEKSSIRFYLNTTPNNGNWVGFDLDGTQSNRDAYGTRLELVTSTRTLTREVRGGSSHASQCDSRVHFGLGEYEQIDSIRIIWPSGATEVFLAPSINEYHELLEGSLTATEYPEANKELSVYPNPASDWIWIEGSYDRIVISDLSGRTYKSTISNSSNQFDISDIPAGTYLISAGSASTIKHTIIQKID